jgi:CBS domain containing-hemolysin-like protein/mannitol/fructose-specific phosphotransferase system IIA component (Ntr-type)
VIELLIIVLIGANALFVLMEFALMRARPARIELMARKGNARAVAVQDIMTRFDEYLAAMQLCITIISLALGAVGEPQVMAELNARFSSWTSRIPASWLTALSFAIAVTVLAVCQIVLAELVPRAIAIHYAEPIALFGARPLKAVAYFLRFPVRLTTGASKAILRLFRLKAASEAEHSVTIDEMRVLLGETHDKGAMPLERLILLENLFDFASAKATEAMRAREKIIFLSLSRPWSENLALIREKKFTRYPLCETDLDTAIGYVHVKDLVLKDVGPEPDLKKLRRDLFEISDAEPLEKLLKTMPDKGIHLALVRDGLGRVSGMLTLEDIIEELIGEVRDEFGRPRGWADGELFARAVVEANLPPGDRRDAITYLIARLKTARPELDGKAAFEAVWERELKFASAVGRGVIVPHARILGLPEPIIAVGRYAKAAAFPTPDGVPVRLVFLILTPAETPVVQLKILQRIASLVINENLRRKLWRAKTDEGLLETLRTADTLLAS